MTDSIFSDKHLAVYGNRKDVLLHVDELHGGIPMDQSKIEGWLASKIGQDKESQIQQLVIETMAELNLDANEALKEVAEKYSLVGFKRIEGDLVIEGRQIKAMIKEAANSRWGKRRWGPTNKGTKSFLAEHVFVPERYIGLGMTEPSGIAQRFISTYRGTGIQYDEYVVDAKVNFTVIYDDIAAAAISDDDWAELWVQAEQLGLGAARSQGYGRFVVEAWG